MKRVPEQVTCPCCGKRRAVGPRRSPLSDEAAMEIRGAGSAVSRSGWSAALANQGLLFWACDRCIESGRAIRAKPWLQEYCCDLPRLAYFDQTRRCRSCGDDFVFGKVEQRRWFEEYKLTPSAEPVECRSCRAARRMAAEVNDELADALARLDPKSTEQLARLATLYFALGRPRKAAESLRRAKNVAEDPALVAKLVDTLREVESKWPAR